MREHEKTAGGSRKGKKSRRRGFLFSSLCRPRSLLCAVRVSNILCDGESSLYKRRYRPGIVCMFFRSHITHHTPPRRICAHRAHTSSAAPPPLRIIQKYFYFYCNCTYTNTLYVHNNYCIPIYCARPPPAPPRRGRR